MLGPGYLLNEVDRQSFLIRLLSMSGQIYTWGDRREGGPEFEPQEISNSNCFFFFQTDLPTLNFCMVCP